MKRSTIFWVEAAFLGLLLIGGWCFFLQCDWLMPHVPREFGPIPVGVPWFGAIGAVLLSLAGIFHYRTSDPRDENYWDESYWPWHLSRPFVGASLGIVSVLILKAGILAVGANPGISGAPVATQPSASSELPPNLLYYLIAFLVGYREETFRALITRLMDVILSPGGDSGPSPTISSFNPSTVARGESIPGLIITGSGFNKTKSVNLGSTPAKFKIDSDTQLTVTADAAITPGDVPLTVRTGNGSATIFLKVV